MARGDQIYVMRPLAGMQGVYEHHGIDCGDGTVIHYSKVGEPTVRRTSWHEFSWGNPVYTRSYPVHYIADVVIERAESRLGEKRYSLMTNNCEHFATWCKTGTNESQQLLTYGLDGVALTSGKLADEVARTSDPVQAMMVADGALENVAIARQRVQTQIQQAQTEMDTWHRVARLALDKQREDLARAALERKVKHKQRLADYQTQLQHLNDLATNLQRNRTLLQQRAGVMTP